MDIRRDITMKFALLASGSKGNCCIVKHNSSSLIIDCGTTKKYLKGCFEQLSYDPMKADALLITHTHTDHISQLKMFEELPTYAAQNIETSNLRNISAFDTFQIKDFHITVLPMTHDCENTVGYLIECGNEKLVYVTDTGYIKKEVKDYLKDADYYIFESNHDIEMLMQTKRPVYVKQRIINDYGHLCNEDSAHILSEVISEEKTKEIVLAHISQEGNTREMALSTLKQILDSKQVNYDGMRLYPADQFSIYIGGNKEM